MADSAKNMVMCIITQCIMLAVFETGPLLHVMNKLLRQCNVINKCVFSKYDS